MVWYLDHSLWNWDDCREFVLMYYKCTKCYHEQWNKNKCDLCEERTLYIIRQYPEDVTNDRTGTLTLGLWKETDGRII